MGYVGACSHLDFFRVLIRGVARVNSHQAQKKQVNAQTARRAESVPSIHSGEGFQCTAVVSVIPA